MKRVKKLTWLLVICMAVSGVLSAYIRPHQVGMSVPKGFAFGAPNNQTRMTADGVYSVTHYGFPSPYRITETFRPTGDVFNTLSYDSMRFNGVRLVTNFVFWLSLFVALLAPVTIFWRPKKKLPAVKPTDLNAKPQVKPDANTGN